MVRDRTDYKFPITFFLTSLEKGNRFCITKAGNEIISNAGRQWRLWKITLSCLFCGNPGYWDDRWQVIGAYQRRTRGVLQRWKRPNNSRYRLEFYNNRHDWAEKNLNSGPIRNLTPFNIVIKEVIVTQFFELKEVILLFLTSTCQNVNKSISMIQT